MDDRMDDRGGDRAGAPTPTPGPRRPVPGWARDHLVVLVQPDGDLAVWSTGGRTLVLRDATEEQVTEHLVARTLAADDGTRRTRDTGGTPGADGRAADGAVERRALQAARWAVRRARQGLQPRVHLPRWDEVAAGARSRS